MEYMAGWHDLSREHKAMFFFITLAFALFNLIPYFPTYTSFQPPFSVPIAHPLHRSSCASSLHRIAFKDVRECRIVPQSNSSWCDVKKSWDWVESGGGGCVFRRLSKPDASALLNGSWVVVAGDSQSRLVAYSLLGSVMGPDRAAEISSSRDGGLSKSKHGSYSVAVREIGMKLDFVWAPFVDGLTGFLERTRGGARPDVLVMGSGPWDMLYRHNASKYGALLRELGDSAQALLPAPGSKPAGLFWVGMPKLEAAKMNTEAKREIMTEELRDSYNDEVVRSKMLSRSGGGPFWFVDLHSLSESCGSQCASDGLHYDGAVYDAAVQIMFNVLLMGSPDDDRKI